MSFVSKSDRSFLRELNTWKAAIIFKHVEDHWETLNFRSLKKGDVFKYIIPGDQIDFGSVDSWVAVSDPYLCHLFGERYIIDTEVFSEKLDSPSGK